MKRLAIIGSGDLGKQMAHHAENDNHYTPVGFFDDFEQRGDIKHELPILGSVVDVLSAFQNDVFDVLLIAIGYKHMVFRKNVFEMFRNKIPFGTVIHSSCYVDSSCFVGEGSFLFPGSVLDMRVNIEKNVLIYTGCIISHDVTIGEHTILSPAVKIAGFVHVDTCVNLGIGTTVIDNIDICEGTVTGAAAVVVKNIDESGLYIGCPAKIRLQ